MKGDASIEKKLSLFVIIIFLIALISCGRTGSNSTSPKDVETMDSGESEDEEDNKVPDAELPDEESEDSEDKTPPTFNGLSSINADDSTKITLSWNQAIDDITPSEQIVYLIYQALSSGAEDLISPSYTTQAGVNSYQVTGLKPATTYYFIVRAKDSSLNIDANTVERFTTTLNNAPSITINNPQSNMIFVIGDSVLFEADATDSEGEEITYSWTSSIDGDLNVTLSEFTTSSLSVGDHTVTLTVTDTHGASTSETVSFTVKPAGWEKILDSDFIVAIAIDPSDPSIIYGGVRGPIQDDGALYKSIDSGQTWSALSGVPAHLDVGDIVIDSLGDIVYVGITGGAGFYFTTDSGNNWREDGAVDSHTVFALAIDPSDSNKIYVGTHLHGMNKVIINPADNYSTTVSHINNGLNTIDDDGNPATPEVLDETVNSIAIDPDTTSTIYIGTQGWGGVYKSTDSGTNWTEKNPGISNNVHVLAIEPETTSTIYAGTDDAGVLKSTNSAENWTQKNTNLTNTNIEDIAINPNDTDIIYVATDGGGVFKSTDAADNWSAKNGSGDYILGDLNVNILSFHPTLPYILYAGTDDGIFILYENIPDSDGDGINDIQDDFPNDGSRY